MVGQQIERGVTVVDRILTRVADEEDCSTLDLPPLFDVVDPDALNRLAESEAEISMSFRYRGYQVVVEGPDSVSVTPV